jgi:hypothetical protein
MASVVWLGGFLTWAAATMPHARAAFWQVVSPGRGLGNPGSRGTRGTAARGTLDPAVGDEPVDVVLGEADVLAAGHLDPRQDAFASESPDVPLGVAESFCHFGSSEKTDLISSAEEGADTKTLRRI